MRVTKGDQVFYGTRYASSCNRLFQLSVRTVLCSESNVVTATTNVGKSDYPEQLQQTSINGKFRAEKADGKGLCGIKHSSGTEN